MSIPFLGARLKIKRAGEHIESLQREVDSYLARSPIILDITQNVDPDYLDWRLTCTEGIPLQIAPIIGDILHNLRSSLDVMAGELVRLNNGNDNRVYFPFAESDVGLERQIKEKHFNRAAPKVIDHLRKLKPYKGGNLALRYVHDLNIMDKHVMLFPSSSHVKFPGGGYGFDFEHLVPRQLRSGSFTRAIGVTDFTPGSTVPAGFRLLFPWRGPLEDHELLQTFYRLLKDFSGIVDSFELLCFGAVSKPL